MMNLKNATALCFLTFATFALHGQQRDTSYTANYFLGIEKTGGGWVCKDLEVKVDIRKEIPRWVRTIVLDELKGTLEPPEIRDYPSEDSLFKTCENWDTDKIKLFAEILHWEKGEKMSVVFYVIREDCCNPKARTQTALVKNIDLRNARFYNLQRYYQKHKKRLIDEVNSKVRRKYSNNRDRRFVNKITIEPEPPIGFDKRGLIVFTLSTISTPQHVPWVVSLARLPEPLPLE